MRAEPLIVTCANLSNQIQKDKNQLRDVLRYLHEYSCASDTPTVPESTCQNLENKQRTLETRITANQQKARDKGCA